MVRRAQAAGGSTPLFDLCLSLCAAADDPVSGGRHKVFGDGDGTTFTPPQTSTIASHLPKAMGTAFAIERGARLDGVTLPVPEDAIVACVFGDASLNHNVARGALAAAEVEHEGVAVVPYVYRNFRGVGRRDVGLRHGEARPDRAV